MRRQTFAAALVVGLMGHEAQAAPPFVPPAVEIATDPEHPAPFEGDSRPRPSYSRRPSRGSGRATVGAALGFGVARQKYSPDGQYARLTMRVTAHDPDDLEPTVNADGLGIDAWRAPGGWGVGMPQSLGVGLATSHLMAYGSLGWSVFSLDHERGKTGFGIFSPLAGASVGVTFEPVRVLLDARAIYRWHVRSNDTPQTQLGLVIELFSRQ